MLVLLQHDAYTHPYVRPDNQAELKKSEKHEKGKKKKKAPVTTEAALPPARPVQYIEEGALDLAKVL